VPITGEEAEAIRKAGAALWRDDAGSASAEPFEPIPGHALFRIRKRSNGACGFLTAEGRCAIHETLGERLKPIACRLFPFSFRPTPHEIVVSASFACPTVITNQGDAVSIQRGALGALQAAWDRAFPEPTSPTEFVRGRAISRDALARMRTYLVLLLDRSPDVRGNLRRIASLLADWSRSKVLKLEPDAFVEYLELTGNYALSAETPAPAREAGRVARLLFRGFLFAVLALQVRLDASSNRGSAPNPGSVARGGPETPLRSLAGAPCAPRRPRGRLAIGFTLARLLAHVHGLGPAVAGFDLRRAMRLSIALDDPAVHAIVHRHLQAGLETLGATRRPVIDEIAMRVSYLNAACVVGAMHAATAGKSSVDAESLTQGLLAAGDLSQTDAGGRLSALLTTFAGGVEALRLFPPLRS